MDERHKVLLTQVEELRRVINQLAATDGGSPSSPATVPPPETPAIASINPTSGGSVNHQQQQQQPSPAPPQPMGITNSVSPPQTSASPPPPPIVVLEEGAQGYVLSWQEYQQLIKIAHDHVSLLRQLHNVKQGSGVDWSSLYWDAKQGLASDECRGVSAYEFRDGLRLYVIPRSQSHRQYLGDGATVSVIYDHLVITVNESLVVDADLRTVTHVEHDATERVLRIGMVNSVSNVGALLGVELECFDATVLRAITHVLSLRKDQIAASVLPPPNHNHIPVDELEAFVAKVSTAGTASEWAQGGGGQRQYSPPPTSSSSLHAAGGMIPPPPPPHRGVGYGGPTMPLQMQAGTPSPFSGGVGGAGPRGPIVNVSPGGRRYV